jgi:hypothetical protein
VSNLALFPSPYAPQPSPLSSLPTIAANEVGPIIVWSLLLIVFLVLMFVAIVYFKKWLSKDDLDSAGDVGFTLGDLRRLHKQGKMSDEEYEKARVQMIAVTKAAAERAAQRAAEQAKARSGATDVDLLRARAKQGREMNAAANDVEPESPEDPK